MMKTDRDGHGGGQHSAGCSSVFSGCSFSFFKSCVFFVGYPYMLRSLQVTQGNDFTKLHRVFPGVMSWIFVFLRVGRWVCGWVMAMP